MDYKKYVYAYEHSGIDLYVHMRPSTYVHMYVRTYIHKEILEVRMYVCMYVRTVCTYVKYGCLQNVRGNLLIAGIRMYTHGAISQ